jgi:CDP-diacylglycerol---serine O-phosphatidyltransferase
VPRSDFLIWLTLLYTLSIASLMVSRLPVYSGKRVGKRVPTEMVGPLIVVVVLFVALLIAYPWVILTAGTLAYLGSLPFGWLSYRAYEQRSRQSRAETAAASALPEASSGVGLVQAPDNDVRPSRLN